MPLWKIYHPVGAYSAQDKSEFASTITDLYAQVPIPRFYVVTIFQEIPADSYYVSGKSHSKFVRLKIDHMARTLPTKALRDWWIKAADTLIVPWVKDRGFDWEITIDEKPADLWSLQGEVPPPFESTGEKRWIEENSASPYTLTEALPASFPFAPGVATDLRVSTP
jgi:phenylpyruvate tautomerase PptA (4-oxalocrotonate tautomerase family)